MALPDTAPQDNVLFMDFFYLLREYGVPVTPREYLDFNSGLEKGVVKSLDDLFVFSRLSFVRRKEHLDAFERAFAHFFLGIDIPDVEEGDFNLLRTKEFQQWLKKAIEEGELPERARWEMPAEELIQKFWDTVREQMEEHHGGSKWVGTKGNSPFGHSGNAERGVRVGGKGGGRSAIKVIGDRRYIKYSNTKALRADNLRQALEDMKHLQKKGAYDVLNLDETISRTAKNFGEIELVFERELRDKIKVVLMIDNGGYSMDPYVKTTRLLFNKMKDRFEEIETFYFHNTVYDRVWKDERRTIPLRTDQLLMKKPETRIVILGDATMAPEELDAPGGAIYFGMSDHRPSVYWLQKIADRFTHTVWLNPISKTKWDAAYGSWTLNRIRQIFHMEDLTLGGVKGMVEHLSEK